MKKLVFLFIISLLLLPLSPTPVACQTIAVFQFFVEIELTNDQGEMSTRDYLKNYSIKGKKRGAEYLYQVSGPFLQSQFAKTAKELMKLDTLSTIKANEYGYPLVTLPKAIESGIADRYMRIHLKDIGNVSLEGVNDSDPLNRQRKIAKMRCRLQIYDKDKNLVAESVGEFQSGEKVENASELGVDLRRTELSEFQQELKIYEVCTKMAILRAVKQLEW